MPRESHELRTWHELPPGDFRNFQSFGAQGGTPDIAGASFLFRISGGGEVIYELTGSVALVFDAASGKNILVSNLDAAEATLSGFRMISAPNSQRQFSFLWDATELLVDFPKDIVLQPGESSTLTYETEVTSFSRTQCFDLLTAACVVAYSSFGDPVGRGGSANPSRVAFGGTAVQRQALPQQTLSFAAFDFQLPEFHKGVLSYDLIGPADVPAPATTAIIAIGLTASLLRRRTSWARAA